MIELIILYVLLSHDLTMYAIHKRILENFVAFTNPSFGAIKPALVRLENQKFITSAKIMSDGGKLSIYYSITREGEKEIKNLLLKPLSSNAIHFFSDARIKISCLSVLNKEESKEVLDDIKANAILHKHNAIKIFEDEYTPKTFYQKIILDNTICEYNNFITTIEGLGKDNARNS